MDTTLFADSSSRRRRRRALALTAVALALAATVGAFALGTTGTSGLAVKTPEGSVNGAVGEVVKLNSKVQASKGAAQLDAGVALARIDVAWKAADELQVDVAWTNVVEAIKKVLQNPHAQISVGLYEPVHAGACSGTKEEEEDKGNEVVSPYVKVTDEYGSNQETKQELCGKLAAAGGSVTVSAEGKLLLTREALNGYLEPTGAGSDTLGDCSEAAAESETWCQPASIAGEKKQDALYLVASIVTPGGTPHGQQPPESAALSFFEHLKHV